MKRKIVLSAMFSGIRNGTCAILERKLGKNLLYLACRHHTNEIILRSVFEIHWDKSSGPNVALFQKFQQRWEQLDQHNYKDGLDDDLVAAVLEKDKLEISNFISDQFQVRIIVIQVTSILS